MVEVPTWLEGDGVRKTVPADLLPAEALGRLTEMWQAEIRNSPLWDQMAEESGQKKAEELLKSFRAELR
jgi:hypothetical protein